MLNQNDILNEQVIENIRESIKIRFCEDHLRDEFPNHLLREDVLSLLEHYCTVIYYPLQAEENNGFHITGIPDKYGKEQHFVFINTAQTIEKQVFTAAHELGHIWKVDKIVSERCHLELNEVLGEKIINRFAAELLIPEDSFKQSFDREYYKYKDSNGRITILNMLKVVVVLMDQFFVPRKSIIYRCRETGRISDSTLDLLLGNSSLSEEIINITVNEIIKYNGYIQFQVSTQKKLINGLAELLNRAEEQKCVSVEKIKHLREQFDLQPPVSNIQMNELL